MDYEFWQASLNGEHREATVGRPELGFYRYKGDAIAIWLNAAGQPIAKVGANARAVPADAAWCERVFAWCARHPVTEQAYRDACEGKPWPDEDPRLSEIAGIGHNAVDEAEAARDQIAAAKDGADAYKVISDDQTAARAQSLRSRLLEIARGVEKRHEVEIEPHKQAAKIVDDKWLPMVKEAKALAKTIRDAMQAWENEKDRQAKAKAKADRERHEAAKKLGSEVAPTPLFEAPAAPAKNAQVRGGYGRVASVRTVRVARIIDQDAVYRVFRSNQEVVDLLQKLAQRAITNAPDVKIEGVEIEQERRVA